MAEAPEAPPVPSSRIRTGALLGALVGPPLMKLVVFPILEPWFAGSGKSATAGGLFFAALFASWGFAIIGLPLLGAGMAAGKWLGREEARRLANHLIGGGLSGGAVATMVRMVHPALSRHGTAGTIVSLIVAEIGMVVGVVLCFRSAKASPPAA